MVKSESRSSKPGQDPDASRVTGLRPEGWLGRLRANPFRFLSIATLTAAAGIGGILTLVMVAPTEPQRRTTESLLAESLQALDSGKLDHARSIAADLRLRTDIAATDRGIPAFVLGAVIYQDAMDLWYEPERKAYFLMAARYLDEARRAGFPTGRDQHALYLLSKSLYGCGRYAESLPHLHELLAKDPGKSTEICRMLADAYLRDHPPNPGQAAEFNRRFLADPAISRSDRDGALLVQARITFEMGEYEECLQQISQFRPEAAGYAEVLMMHGRLLLAMADRMSSTQERGADAAALYTQARALLNEAQSRSVRNMELLRQVQYLHGLCLRRLGDLQSADVLLNRTRRSFLESPEGLAAGIEEAEVQFLLGNHREALDVYRRVLRRVPDSPQRTLPWIPDDDLRNRLEKTVAEFRQAAKTEMALDLLESIRFAFPDARTGLALASLYEEWAESLAKQARDSDTKDPAAMRSEARAKYRLAGLEFSNLGKLRFSSRDYPSDMWRSAENYLRGQDFESAVQIYQKNLASQSGAGRPPALTRLGESLLGLDRPEEALKYVDECIAYYPKDPFVYRARLIAAEANLELGRTQVAKDLLTANLENEALTPQSREWRDSLFTLGRIYYRDATHYEVESLRVGLGNPDPTRHLAGMKQLELAHAAFGECLARLGEAVEREPDAEQSVESRYMLAMSHVASAQLPKQRLAGINVETTRVALRRDIQRELQAAAAEFEELRKHLFARNERAGLSPVESRILRNCYFGKADTLFELGQFAEAEEAYSSATNRYQQEPEAIEAYLQMAICQRRLNRHADARHTLDQAKLILARLPAEAIPEKTTRYTRKEWEDVLGWLTSL